MKNKAIEYPHPVLNKYSNDFVNSEFSIEILSHDDNGDSITLEISVNLQCDGIEKMIRAGEAKIVLKVTCVRTSFRKAYDLSIGTSSVSFLKKDVADVVDLRAIIVATKDLDNYSLDEFNKNYFGTTFFKLRKADVLATEPGIELKLDTALEKNMAGIVQISRGDTNVSEMKVHYASIEETDPALTNYIYITLPPEEYDTWSKFRTKKYLKNGIERFLQSSIVLPAITEAISLLMTEEKLEEDDENEHYKGTVWAESIINALRRFDIDDLSTVTQSAYALANKLLGNVTGDAINELMQKMIDWTTIRQEDDVL